MLARRWTQTYRMGKALYKLGYDLDEKYFIMRLFQDDGDGNRSEHYVDIEITNKAQFYFVGVIMAHGELVGEDKY